MIPAISVVGKSNSGKTTLVEILVKELRHRGYRIATIKHSHGNVRIDTRGKDTWRHAMAGAETVVLSSPGKFAFIKNLEKELQLDEILEFIDGVDLIIAEGYRSLDKPKIAVIESIDEVSLIKKPVFAIVSNKKILIPKNFKRKQKIPCFNFYDPELANMIEDKFIKNVNKNGRKTYG